MFPLVLTVRGSFACRVFPGGITEYRQGAGRALPVPLGTGWLGDALEPLYCFFLFLYRFTSSIKIKKIVVESLKVPSRPGSGF